MDRILAPRGGERTYQVCKYAIEHDCDIIVPGITNIKYCLNTLKKICDDSDGELSICEIGGWGAEAGYHLITIKNLQNEKTTIKVYTANGFLCSARGAAPRDYIADDADKCLKSIIGQHLKACSIMTYDPTEVALSPAAKNNECVCSSLL